MPLKPIENVYNRDQVEYDEKWREWAVRIPALKFKKSWSVQIVPPWGQMLTLFIVKKANAKVSVAFEFNYPSSDPTWEIYPDASLVNTAQFDMDDTDGVLKGIAKSLKAQIKSKTTQEDN